MSNLSTLLFAGLLVASSGAVARDTIGNYSIQEALSLDEAKTALGNDVKFYFGDQPYGKIGDRQVIVKTNKKTNAFGKSDKAACDWAFLSAMIALKNSAQTSGANAVVNIRSNYRDRLTSSETTYQCGAGAVMAGVALVGTVVTIAP